MMERFNSTTGEYIEMSKFIDWKKFVPISTKSKLKTDESPEIQEASFNLDIVNDAVNSFTTKVVRFIATGGKNKPFIVTPCDYSSYEHEEFSEYAMIMPLMS